MTLQQSPFCCSETCRAWFNFIHLLLNSMFARDCRFIVQAAIELTVNTARCISGRVIGLGTRLAAVELSHLQQLLGVHQIILTTVRWSHCPLQRYSGIIIVVQSRLSIQSLGSLHNTSSTVSEAHCQDSSSQHFIYCSSSSLSGLYATALHLSLLQRKVTASILGCRIWKSILSL